MSVLVVGLSHKSAPVATLERAVVSGDTLTKLLRDLVQAEPVAEAFVISTCNRVEVYAEVDRFHAGVTAICELLARHCGVPSPELTPHLYVHYEERAVSHLLAVAAGLDSMVVGEDQILGQVRSAVKLAEEHGTAGRVLGELGRLALRTGKRARAETTIGRAGLSLLSAAMEVAAGQAGTDTLSGRRVLIVGAGSMSALAAATAARSGAASIAVANRTKEHAERVAATVGTSPTTVSGLDTLPAALAAADVVISCTGAAGHVLTVDVICAALAARSGSAPESPESPGGPLVIMDLAMPRDVEPGVADLPGVVLIGMDQLREHASAIRDDDVAAVRAILEAELAGYQSAMDAARVAPVVVALRAKAAKVVDAELTRLSGRLSADDLSGHALDEIAQAVRRVVDKLLHAPTVRVKELAGSPGGEEYAAALRVLFDLDPRAVEAVTRAAPEQEGSR
ncbi:MAG TPA: glutamyl-tRNA reductase [Streptosporangiaceae bacterium]|nr:glutamyl-tRNA reductase [Streptosporangiaceae bacterium]